MSEGDVVRYAFTTLKEAIESTNPERAPFVKKFIDYVYDKWDTLLADAALVEADNPVGDERLEREYSDVEDEGETFDFILAFIQKLEQPEAKVYAKYNVKSEETPDKFYKVRNINALHDHPLFNWVHITYKHEEKKFYVRADINVEPMQIDTAFVDLNYRRRQAAV